MKEKIVEKTGDGSDCGCKSGPSTNEILNETSKKKNIGLVNGFFRVLTFSIFLLLVPFITMYFIWAAFKMIVLNKNVDIKSALLAITKGKTEMAVNEDDDDYDELVMMDVEDISEQYRK
jgi:hypothetical protein